MPRAAGEESSLELVLGALLGNACDALEEGAGEVRVTIRAGVPGDLEGDLLSAYPDEPSVEGCLCVEVGDTGSGLSPESMARFFEPYFSTRSGRRGLGLASVLGVVRGLGGAIEVVAPPEGGTQVRVLLPAVASVRQPIASAALAEPLGGTVLVIDDELAVLDVASRLVGSLGCSVLTAQDGEEALACLEQPGVEVRAPS